MNEVHPDTIEVHSTINEVRYAMIELPFAMNESEVIEIKSNSMTF